MAIIRHNIRSANTNMGTNLDSRFDTLITATGGTITTDGDFKIHTFTSSGTFTINTVQGLGEVRMLVVAGGGGGAWNGGGGGGAGGMIEDTYIMTAGQYIVNVGAGGGGRTDDTELAAPGSNSTVDPDQSTTPSASINGYDDTITAVGGGQAGPGGSGSFTTVYYTNRNGGSGAGWSAVTEAPSKETWGSYASNEGTSGQGNAGGGMVTYGTTSTFIGGGGGGGARTSGITPAQGSGPIGGKGHGGSGRETTIRGSLETFAGGGGGGYGSWQNTVGADGGAGGGGSGGAKDGVAPVAGSANTGGGGGGGAYSTGSINGANGGSGIVVFRYRFQG